MLSHGENTPAVTCCILLGMISMAVSRLKGGGGGVTVIGAMCLGDRLGRVTLGQRIGIDNYGEVHKGLRRGTEVALKQLLEQNLSPQRGYGRLCRGPYSAVPLLCGWPARPRPLYKAFHDWLKTVCDVSACPITQCAEQALMLQAGRRSSSCCRSVCWWSHCNTVSTVLLSSGTMSLGVAGAVKGPTGPAWPTSVIQCIDSLLPILQKGCWLCRAPNPAVLLLFCCCIAYQWRHIFQSCPGIQQGNCSV
jgi:hypothetical protein